MGRGSGESEKPRRNFRIQLRTILRNCIPVKGFKPWIPTSINEIYLQNSIVKFLEENE